MKLSEEEEAARRVVEAAILLQLGEALWEQAVKERFERRVPPDPFRRHRGMKDIETFLATVYQRVRMMTEGETERDNVPEELSMPPSELAKRLKERDETLRRRAQLRALQEDNTPPVPCITTEEMLRTFGRMLDR
eukprot:Sspe_Gene.19512::Locus_7118_Transcript_1_1_Confidence_1.000_Length_601::g.19512::m.19512